jgi:hypothetical protein
VPAGPHRPAAEPSTHLPWRTDKDMTTRRQGRQAAGMLMHRFEPRRGIDLPAALAHLSTSAAGVQA